MASGPIEQLDSSHCEAATKIASELANIFIDDDKYCFDDKDCSEVNFIGGPMCGSRMVNKVGRAGYEIMLKSSEYKKIKKIVDAAPTCGPIPSCAQRPPGKVKCQQDRCTFVFDK